MGMGFAPTWLRQVSPPPASHDHFNYWQQQRSFRGHFFQRNSDNPVPECQQYGFDKGDGCGGNNWSYRFTCKAQSDVTTAKRKNRSVSRVFLHCTPRAVNNDRYSAAE